MSGRRDDDLITASEISEYMYCPIAWYIQRSGKSGRGLRGFLLRLRRHKSKRLADGTRWHDEVGGAIRSMKREERRSRLLGVFGTASLLLAACILAWWMI